MTESKKTTKNTTRSDIGTAHEPPEAESGNSELKKSRRKLLRGMASGAGAIALMPDSWTRPVTRTIVVPAHAQATGPTTTTGTSTTTSSSTTSSSTTSSSTTSSSTTTPA